MIEKIINKFENKNENLIIVDIGSSDCIKSIEFYKHFPNSKIYVFDCEPNTLDICTKNIEPYKNRITLIEDIYDGNIDICYINNNDFIFVQNKIALSKVKLLVNNNNILFDNTTSNLEMFCIYHKKKYFRHDNFYFTFFGVNEVYPKEKNIHTILEYELNIYNPFLQKRGYMETSAYLHVYWNKLYKNKDMIGFSQYDMTHNTKYDNISKNTIYVLNANISIVKNKQWNPLMFSTTRDLQFLIKSYNKHFDKTYTINELENQPLTLWQTNIYPVNKYEKLCSWLEILVEEIYPWSNEPPHSTQFGFVGGYTERALSIFNAFEFFEGVPYYNLNITHVNGLDSKEQYNEKSFLNNYSKDIHTKYIDDITGNYSSNYCMFKAECYLNNIKYNCERVNINNRNGLYFMRSDWEIPKQHAFDIEGGDPRIFILNNQIYVIFVCLSPYKCQKKCIGITLFNNWNPNFLQIDNMKYNIIEENWAPFVKDNKLFFVYNYDPLIIIHYDFNTNGICNVVYKQDNISLPLDTSNMYLRGGTNLIEYNDHCYIGGCNSIIYNKCEQHYTNIILLDTLKWKIIYLSKPIMYIYNLNEKLNAWHLNNHYDTKEIDKIHNILNDRTPNIIQEPISLYIKEQKYFMTINIRDCISFLFEIDFKNLLDLKECDTKHIGYYNNMSKHYLDCLNN